MRIQRFEDIKAWQEARILVNQIYSIVRTLPSFTREYRFRDQITSSAISIMANIAEGFSRRSNKEFIQFLFIAKGSAAELQSHHYIANDQNMIDGSKFNEMFKQIDKTARLISSFITYLLNNPQTQKNSTNATNPTNSTN